MRKLATVRKINKILPIQGADFIELALVDGWQCIVKKGAFKEGDSGVYFEIDSMLPLIERYAFLGKSTNDNTGEGYRIRTMKMRKQLSQGLMLPMDMFNLSPIGSMKGADVTKELGVWLYEPKMRQGSARSHFNPVGVWPNFLPKTDQERIQNKMHYFDTYEDEEWEVTLKLDGSSMTVWNYDNAPLIIQGKYNKPWKNKLNKWYQTILSLFSKPATFGVCSRNINLKDTEGNAFWDVAKEIGILDKIAGHNVAVQGELIGPRIQDNHEKVEENQFWIFDVFDIDKQEYMTPLERDSFLRMIDRNATLNHVPISHTNFKLKGKDFNWLQGFVTGEGMNKGVHREGFVFKSLTTKGLSFKCISNKYLLKCEE